MDEIDKIEIPRFFLSYFGSTTIRTPLSSIMGRAHIMLQGIEGPITERQREELEIIHNNARSLFEYWSFAIEAIRYIAYKPDPHLYDVSLDDLVKQCIERIKHYSTSLVELHTPEEPMPIWTDLLHTESVFDCIGRLTSDVYRAHRR